VLFLILVFLVINVGVGYLGRWISVQHGRSGTEGFLLGFFLGVIGLLIAALLPKPLDVRIREAVVIDQARESYKQPGTTVSSRSLSFMDAVGAYRQVNAPPTEGLALAQPSAAQARNSALRRMPSLNWNTIVEAAAELPAEQLEAVRDTVEFLWKTHDGPLSSIMGMGEDGSATLLLLFPDELLLAKCRTGYPSLKHLYNGRPCQFVVEQDSAGTSARIGLGTGAAGADQRLDWIVAPQPTDAVLGLINDLRGQPWVNLRVDSVLKEGNHEIGAIETELPSQALAGATESRDQPGEHSNVSETSRQGLLRIQELREEGFIDEQEYGERRSALLDRAINEGL
jgi:hypothetical protein